MNEQELIEKAETYLKEMYDEETVSMEITGNIVNAGGTGVLSRGVYCLRGWGRV